MAPAGQKRLRRKLRSDVWPKVCYGLTTPRNRHPLATGDPIAPTWARYYDFGAGRLPTFLQRLLDSGSAGVVDDVVNITRDEETSRARSAPGPKAHRIGRERSSRFPVGGTVRSGSLRDSIRPSAEVVAEP